MVRERVGGWRLAWRFALVGLLAGVLVAGLSTVGLMDRPFYAAQDQLFPAPAPDPNVTLVAMDSSTAKSLGPFPLPNSDHARVIDYLASLHPKVILVDLILDHLTGTDSAGQKGDDMLASAIKAAGNVVLVCTADDAPLAQFSSVAAAVGDRGLANPDAASAVRGVVLRPPRTCQENQAGEPAFIEALRISAGISTPLTVSGTEAQFGPHRIPLAGDQMLINYTRGTNPTCLYIAAFHASCPRPDLITNHIVVVGIKFIDAGDVYSQPVSFKHDPTFCPATRRQCMLDNQNFGYRIMGDAISTVLSDRYLRVQPGNSIVFGVLVLSLVIAVLVYLMSFRLAMVATALILAIYIGGISLLGQNGFLPDPLYGPLAIVLGAGFSLAARYLLEERERRKVERIFGQYVDPRIARQLAASRSVDEIISKGERRDLTMLFVDIRGFTAMSEAMRAEDVLAVIQDYLNEMSSLILKWDGTIDKYVGDEIVALWNAPVAQPNHALLALRCAYDLVQQAPALHARLAAKGLPPISWGIGVNTGPAVVGNMGSKERLQYTALGDTVNTAARFCSAAPAFNLLIGWPTFVECSKFIAVDEMPGLQLKGKSAEKFRVMRVTAIREEPGSPWAEFPTQVAADSYQQRRQQYAQQGVFAAGAADDA
jgi:adenylate cyclase